MVFGKSTREEESVEDDDITIANNWSPISDASIAIVDFGAVWCGPCIRIAPIFRELAAEFKCKATFFSVNVDNAQVLAADQGVSALPAFHFYKNGELCDKLVGADAKALRQKVEAICS